MNVNSTTDTHAFAFYCCNCSPSAEGTVVQYSSRVLLWIRTGASRILKLVVQQIGLLKNKKKWCDGPKDTAVLRQRCGVRTIQTILPFLRQRCEVSKTWPTRGAANLKYLSIEVRCFKRSIRPTIEVRPFPNILCSAYPTTGGTTVV